MVFGTDQLMLAPLALAMGSDVKPMARKLFDETKTQVKAKWGDNIYSESYGEQILKNKAQLTKRLNAGLTLDDVRDHWNQPLLMQILQLKVIEMVDFIAIDSAYQSGQDVEAMVRSRKKTTPSYGDPEAWNASLPVNKGFTSDDADLYPEFLRRVGRWQEKTSPTEQSALLSNSSSFNAMIRTLVRDNKI